MISKDIITKNFSQCANYYDNYADIQNFCALKLIEKAGDNNFLKILEIGCGTGNYTKLLVDKFPEAQIKAIDISKEMLLVAKKKLGDRDIKLVSCDGEAIDLRGHFDLITSNSCFQWFDDLGKTLHRYKELLSVRGGIILFSISGPLTFWELDKSLKKALGNNKGIVAGNFIKRQEIEKVLKRSFKKINIEEKTIKKRYSSLIDLLKTIKYTGTRGDHIVKRVWTPNLISKIESIYREDFSHSIAHQKSIIATYQFFFCKATR